MKTQDGDVLLALENDLAVTCHGSPVSAEIHLWVKNVCKDRGDLGLNGPWRKMVKSQLTQQDHFANTSRCRRVSAGGFGFTTATDHRRVNRGDVAAPAL